MVASESNGSDAMLGSMPILQAAMRARVRFLQAESRELCRASRVLIEHAWQLRFTDAERRRGLFDWL